MINQKSRARELQSSKANHSSPLGSSVFEDMPARARDIINLWDTGELAEKKGHRDILQAFLDSYGDGSFKPQAVTILLENERRALHAGILPDKSPLYPGRKKKYEN